MSFGRLLVLLLAIHVLLGLILGYWDIRLSDAFLHAGQTARIHYYQTLLAHFVLGVLIALAMAIYVSLHLPSSSPETLVPDQVALGISLLAFLIIGVKLHLVWLQTHLLDPEGLIWTAVLIVGVIALFFVARWIARKIYARPRRGAIWARFAVVYLAFVAYSLLFVRVPAAAPHPNVILIVVDTLRWDHVGAYGYAKKTTPSIDAMAHEGAVYETAISASPWTTPSHAAMFTGQYPSRNGVDGRNIILNPASHTLAEILARNGYQTAGFINNVYIRRQTGMAKGFQQYEEFWGRNEVSSIMLLIELACNYWHPRKDTGAQETRMAVHHWLMHDWTRKNPFFLFIHFMEPHVPYGIPDTYYSTFLPSGVSADQARAVNQDPEPYICDKIQMTDRDFQILNALYDNDIRYLDDQIGALVDSLRKQNLLDNTLLIFTADHGEHFGDHHLMSHELSVYDTLLRIPLIIRYPAKIHADTRISNVVQTVDFFPSIVRFLNLNVAGLDLQGASLLPLNFDREKIPFAYAEYRNDRAVDKIERRFPGAANPVFRRKYLRTIRSADFKFILGSDGTRELYAVNADPYETNDLVLKQPQEARILEDTLTKWSSSFKASTFYKKEDISKEALEELRALGYVQ
jgi:arylsulfatase A-like enzyme